MKNKKLFIEFTEAKNLAALMADRPHISGMRVDHIISGRANQAMAFLKEKLHTCTDEFKWMEAEQAIDHAIEVIVQYKESYLETEKEALAQAEKDKSIRLEAIEETKTLMTDKITPAFEALEKELLKLSKIKGFTFVMSINEREDMLSRFKKIIEVPQNPHSR